MTPRLVVPIDQGWVFREADADGAEREEEAWLPVSQFPTNVHLDLLAHGRIPDPFVGKNEEQVQWVGERRWAYRTAFVTPAAAAATAAADLRTVLALDGLDTFATVTLNGTTVLESDNMFVPHRVDVGAALAPAGAPNELVLVFDSAHRRGWQRVAQHPDHKWGCWNGDNSRLAVRKAQYHWGWDWGPTLITCGPWKPICLEVYASRIADLSFDTDVDPSLRTATVEARAEIEAAAPGARVRFDIALDGAAVASETVQVSAEGEAGEAGDGTAAATFHIASPALWYPARYGAQPLYSVRATLLVKPADQGDDEEEEEEADVVTKRIGLRRAELVQQALEGQPGTSFFFRINNTPVFCGGSNWIPADSFLPRISRRRYDDWVRRAVEGNQAMIRVWGGGVYEDAAFYEACDARGVLVWQDFLFGCGNYPAWPALRASIRREAEANVRRLRHHPSIVLWAGNNEDYQYAESAQLTYDYGNQDAASWLQTDFPARYIYEKILADVCAALVPRTAYHFGSPWGGGVDTHDPTVGDIHQWNVWHGTQERYQDWDRLGGRFVSEFGMEALPSVRTVDGWLPGGRHDADRYAQSATMDHHNKAAGHERRLALYLVENIRYAPDPLEQYVYSTQLMQAECLATAYRLWKRQWQGPGREYCGGALVWQLNDCWPVTSWSICDYHLRPKLAYYAVKREMAALTVGIQRRRRAEEADAEAEAEAGAGAGDEKDSSQKMDVWACNLSSTDQPDVVVEARAWDVETGQPTALGYPLGQAGQPTSLPANRSTEITVLALPAARAAREVVAVYLWGPDGALLARAVSWPEPLKYLHLPQPKALTARLAASGDALELRAEVPVKGVAVEVEVDGDGDGDEAEDVHFLDNLVDLVPGETVPIGVRGATEATRFRTRYLGMGL